VKVLFLSNGHGEDLNASLILGALRSQEPSLQIGAMPLVGMGNAYRRLQVNDRITFNDISEVAFELQAGLGMQISDRASLSLNYQGIFNGNTTYNINATSFTGHISNIPVQNGILLSLSYAV
jgi:hypothetical protein